MGNQQNNQKNKVDEKKNSTDDANKGGDNNSAGEDKKDKKKKSKLFRVKFLKSYTPYIKGDVAGLDPEEAKGLIKGKICEKV